MTRRAIGDVRPSQLVSTFGPGAIVDLPTLSVIVAGIDHWPIDDDLAIHEPRLERALRVSKFFGAKASEGSFYNKQGTVPTYLFPRFQVCPVCQTISTVGEGYLEYDDKRQELKCAAPGCAGQGKHRATTLPAPFIVACASGHIDDFPWRNYLHRGATACRRKMSLYSLAQTGTVSDILVKCECGQTRSVSDAFGEGASAELGACTKRRPWLGNNQDAAQCTHSLEVKAMQRGATNAWFPVVRSALAIKEATTPLGRALGSCSSKQIEKVDSLDKLRTLIELGMFPPLEAFAPEDVWAAIGRQRGEVETDELDLKWPEWLALRETPTATGDGSELFLEEGRVPSRYEGLVAKVVLARKLLEVRALTGFTRLDAAGVGTGDVPNGDVAPLYIDRQDWLPAVEVRGEGIFIELDLEAVERWEKLAGVSKRALAMEKKFAEWEAQRDATSSKFPGARFVLLHSLAHALIRQLALDCGYSASSVRERIYSNSDAERPMAGILLYTASADSEGSLGGLVDLGSPQRFPELFRSALRSSARCSSDPLCADHQPDVHATINGAACHACILASETSCETFNRFLDRNFLVPTMAEETLAFFPSVEE